MDKKCKIIAFSGGCYSGKTTTMLRVKEILEALDIKVIMLNEIARDTNIISIDDIRSKPSEYLTFQEQIIRKKISQEIKCLDYEDCVVLVDRAIADSLFYLTFYTDKNTLSTKELYRFTKLYTDVHEYAMNTAYNKLYDLVFQFEPIEIKEDAGNMRPNKLKYLQCSEYNAINTLNVFYCTSNNTFINSCKLVNFNVINDTIDSMISLIKKL